MAASVRFFNGTSRSNPEKNQKLRIMMPTRWPNYSLFVFAALFGLILPMVLSAIWSWVRGNSRVKDSADITVPESSPLRIGEASPIALRFHLAVLLFLGFFGTALLLIPLLFAVRSERVISASLSIGGIAIPFVIALFYCIRKGDLSWGTTRSRDDRWEGE
jgi:NADH:ubiquinone oxidoreductase subunit 3 (subunit A)